MGGDNGDGASAPSPGSLNQCAAPGCRRDVWATRKDRRWLVHSAYCYEHANVPVVDVSAVPVSKPPGRANPAAVFRQEVARRREREERR
jgi:hypothetical protein